MNTVVAEVRFGRFVRAAAWSGAAVLWLSAAAWTWLGLFDWDKLDFAVSAVLLFGAAAAVHAATRALRDTARMIATLAVLATSAALLWINLAVGIVGSEDHPANLIYSVVLAGSVVSACLVRFEPRRMIGLSAAAALSIICAPLAALFVWKEPISALTAAFAVSGLLAVMWLGLALLFRRAEASAET